MKIPANQALVIYVLEDTLLFESREHLQMTVPLHLHGDNNMDANTNRSKYWDHFSTEKQRIVFAVLAKVSES